MPLKLRFVTARQARPGPGWSRNPMRFLMMSSRGPPHDSHISSERRVADKFNLWNGVSVCCWHSDTPCCQRDLMQSGSWKSHNESTALAGNLDYGQQYISLLFACLQLKPVGAQSCLKGVSKEDSQGMRINWCGSCDYCIRTRLCQSMLEHKLLSCNDIVEGSEWEEVGPLLWLCYFEC